MRTRTSRSTRFNLKFFMRALKKRHPGKLHFLFFFTKKVSIMGNAKVGITRLRRNLGLNSNPLKSLEV